MREPQKRASRCLGPEGRPAKRQPSPEGLGHQLTVIPSAVGAAPLAAFDPYFEGKVGGPGLAQG
jgi:hypothetical protein